MGKKIKIFLENILPYLTVFIATIYRPIDPDLGWHLKYGEYFFKNFRILRENTFSTEMADFIWANISWGADLIYYALYRMGGFVGLSIGGAAVVTLTFYFFTKAFRLDFWEKAIIFPIVLFLMNPVNANSFRGQQVSLLFFGILVYLFTRYEEERGQTIYLIPLLFLIWANTHGLFVLGLGVFGLWEGIYILSQYIDSKKFALIIPEIKKLSIITVVSIVATLIHPFGIKIYEDALLHFNDPLLKRIAEYLPAAELSQQWMNLVFTLVLAGIGLVSYVFTRVWRKKLPQIGVFVTLYILSTWVRRYSWAMYYLVIPFLKFPANFLRPDSKKGVFYGATILFVIYLTAILLIKQPYNQFTEMNWSVYCSDFSHCSPKAAIELRKHYIEGKTMTLYNWGGWLIWNYPDMKPSSDGRMHLWRDSTGYNAFEHDYNYEQNIKDIHDSKYDVVFTATYKPIYNRLLKLTEEKKWNFVYKDPSTVIFTRVR
jgi:hypothetical protein